MTLAFLPLMWNSNREGWTIIAEIPELNTSVGKGRKRKRKRKL